MPIMLRDASGRGGPGRGGVGGGAAGPGGRTAFHGGKCDGSFTSPAGMSKPNRDPVNCWNGNPSHWGHISGVRVLANGASEGGPSLSCSSGLRKRSSDWFDVSGPRTGHHGRSSRGAKVLEEMLVARNTDTFHPSTSPLCMKASASGTGHCSGSRRRTRNSQ